MLFNKIAEADDVSKPADLAVEARRLLDGVDVVTERGDVASIDRSRRETSS
jgi:hypothetical protein